MTLEQQRINDSYKAEWRDRVEYGPGNEQSKQTWKTVGKVMAKTSISLVASTALVAATGGAGAVVIGGLVAGEGYLLKKVGEESDSKVLEFIVDAVFDTELGTVTGGVLGGLVGSNSSSLVPQGTKSISKKTAKEIAVNDGKMTHKAASLISFGKTLAETSREVRMVCDAYGLTSDAWEVRCRSLHGEHIDEGQSYKEDCPVCQKKI